MSSPLRLPKSANLALGLPGHTAVFVALPGTFLRGIYWCTGGMPANYAH
jgi:hypothetical protein